MTQHVAAACQRENGKRVTEAIAWWPWDETTPQRPQYIRWPLDTIDVDAGQPFIPTGGFTMRRMKREIETAVLEMFTTEYEAIHAVRSQEEHARRNFRPIDKSNDTQYAAAQHRQA
ncbi:hypothetical protein E4U55_002630 [Claviceps digitariae]|nr:hypothetical protein E4U55_002630 [Claviceps digitariae]